MSEEENKKDLDEEEEEVKEKEKGKMSLVSPDQMMEAGKEIMLEGKEPTSRKDWILLFNFFAANIVKGAEDSVCKIMAVLYNAPLTQIEIKQICDYQMKLKN